MEAEKIYYAAVVLVSAVSVLLSPFFYVRSGRKGAGTAKRAWRKVAAVNVLAALVLLAVWWFWLRQAV